ncbi:MAG: hypothetical protein L0Y43_07555 [Methylococcaceae bacterium]|nr:hypothetical protein [Methylococcaceae bacterium]
MSAVLRASALTLIVASAGCDSQTTPELVENGYPTLARVEYVLQCMEKNGGQNLDALYPCACSIDKIAAQLSYEDFAEAQTFTFMRDASGEAAGLFRDPPRAKELREQLEEAEGFARKNCFVKHVAAPKS